MPQLHRNRRGTRLALSVCTIAGLALASMGNAAAQKVTVETTTATGYYFELPKGDHLTATRAQSTQRSQASPLHYAISQGRLAAIKSLRGAPAGAETATEAAPAAAPAVAQGPPQLVKRCATNNSDMWTPSDIHGAVSTTHIVVVTNDAFGLYRKQDCGTLSQITLEEFFKAKFNIPATEGIFDPRVLYDAGTGRFFVTAESTDAANFDQFQYFAVSTNGTGSGWHIYRIVLSKGNNTLFCKRRTTGFWDYPSAGFNSRRWFIAANDFPSGAPDEGGGIPSHAAAAEIEPTAALISFDKTPTLTGDPITAKCFKLLQFNLAPPIVLDEAPKAYFLSPGGDGEGNSIKRYALQTSGAHATSDTLTTTTAISIPAWTAAPNAPQPNGQRLDTLEGRFQSASIQVGTSLWNVHTINVGGFARWRLYKFSIAGAAPLFSITPSSVGAKNDFLFNPSVATRSGSPYDPAFVTFTRTIPAVKNSAGFASMLIAKGPNASAPGWGSVLISTSLDQYIRTGYFGGSTTCNADPDIHTCRWGDYSATQIDPSATNSAWGFNQLIVGETSKNWITKGALVK